MCEFESGFDLVVGREYKVCLKPFDELLALGLAERWEKDCTWYKDYLGCGVGSITIPSQEGKWWYKRVPVHWSDGGNYSYDLKELEILGEG